MFQWLFSCISRLFNRQPTVEEKLDSLLNYAAGQTSRTIHVISTAEEQWRRQNEVATLIEYSHNLLISHNERAEQQINRLTTIAERAVVSCTTMQNTIMLQRQEVEALIAQSRQIVLDIQAIKHSLNLK